MKAADRNATVPFIDIVKHEIIGMTRAGRKTRLWSRPSQHGVTKIRTDGYFRFPS
jgi:hypothetical protein